MPSKLATLLACALLVVALPAAQAASRRPGPRNCGETRVDDFTVVAEPERKSYSMGETVVVNMTVSRPGPNDPATGQPWPQQPPSQPAANVHVGINLATSDTALPVWQSGTTDENGEATLKVKLIRGDPPRWVPAYASADNWYNRGGCPDVREAGGTDYEKFIYLES